MIEPVLELIGLTKGEIKIYLALLELGSTTTGRIIEKSHVSGSKTYEVLERLMQKGLVSYIIKDNTKYFEATSPERIFDYLEQKENEIKSQKNKVKNIIPALKLKQTLSEYKNEATIFKGFEGIKTAHENILRELKRGDELLDFGLTTQPKSWEAYFNDFQTRRAVKGIALKQIIHEEYTSVYNYRKKLKNTQLKTFPKTMSYPSVIEVFKDKVLITVIEEKGIAILIENKKVADLFRTQFYNLWNQDSKIYTGTDGVKTVFDDTLNYKDVYFIGGNWGIKEYFYQYWKEYEQKRLQKKVFWHDLIVRTYQNREHYEAFQSKNNDELKKKYYYEFRELPRELASPHVIGFYDNKVLNILWGKETRILVIENKDIMQYYKKYFDFLWKTAKKATKNI